MENQWSIPLTDPQGHHGIPPIAERIAPAVQPAYQQGEDATAQNCSCVWCSDAQHTQVRPMIEYPNEQQDPSSPGDQNVNNRVETATIVPEGAWAPFITPQSARVQKNFGYAPAQESAGLPNMRPPLDAPIAENLRRLAGQYLNNPNAHVSTIRLGPGPSGELQIVITLGMANIF